MRKLKLLTNAKLYDFVLKKLELFWSPEQISIAAKKKGLYISFKSIYNAVKRCILPNIKPQSHLRRRGKKYYYGGRKKFNTIQPEHTIHERSVSANNRSRFGNWEGDTVYGGIGKGVLVTLIDRKSRFLVAKISKSKKQEDVRDAVIEALKGFQNSIGIHSITLDNGSEFADFKKIEKELNTTIYFADPHSPWQRGSNENMNDILRFFYPKGVNFKAINDEDIQKTVYLINNRPRKCLKNLSPYQYLIKRKKLLHLI